MDSITAFTLLNIAHMVTYFSGGGIMWRQLESLLEFIFVFWLAQDLLNLVETAVSTVWPGAGVYVAAFLATFTLVLVAPLVF